MKRVAVFIASRNTSPSKRRVLWHVSESDARKICSDRRTGAKAHPNHMLCYSYELDPEYNVFVSDNGRYADVLAEHGVTILASKTHSLVS